MDTIDVRLLGGFSVAADGRTVGPADFPQRRAADLIKVLALTSGHRLPRDAVVEALWPHLGAEAGLANLHKAAHHARRALGAPEAVVLRRGLVELAPAAEVTTDVARFEAGDDDAYGGELLPDDRYEPWTLATRERLHARRLEALRRARRWTEVLAEDPADEEAHCARMRELAVAGDLAGAARQFRLLREELSRLGLRPEPGTVLLHQQLCSGPAIVAPVVHTGPMLGRDDELATASRALAEAGDGRGGGLLVVGDAGIGKTRFVDAVTTMAAQRGYHVLRATAREAEGRTPYRPLAEALEPLMSERPDLVAGLSEPTQRVLGLLSPVTMTDGSGTARGHDVLAAIGRLLAAAARERGAVLAIEDLHAADETTLRVLHYVVGAARRERLLVVLSERPDEGTGSVAELRRTLLEQRAGTEVALRPLAPDRARMLVMRAAPHPLPGAMLDAIVSASAGNPFFAEELAAAVDRTAGLTMPDRLEALLDARLARLEDVAPRLVDVLAVLDDGCTAAEIGAVAGLDGPAVAAELEAGRATGVLACARGTWSFRHPLLRAAARRRLPAERLAEAHREAAAHLVRSGGAPERIAAHLLEAGQERAAVPLLRAAAGAAAEIGAFADGVRWVELALRHADHDDRPELMELLADLRHATGDPRAASDYAAAAAVAVAPETAQRLRLKQARAHVALGDLAGARAAVEAAGDTCATECGDTLFVKGMIAWHQGDIAMARRYADKAAVCAAQHGDRRHDAGVYDLQAMVAHAEGRWERAMEAQLADVWHVPQLAGRVLDAYLCVTEYVLNASDPADTMMRFARDLHEQASGAGARRGVAFAATVLGEAHLLSGDPEAAREHLLEAARLSRELGAVGGEALARTRLGEALAVLGRRAESRAQLEEAIELAHASSLAGHVMFMAYAPLVRAPQDPAEAMVLVDRAEALLDPVPSCKFCPIEYYVAAAIACARAGECERGRGFLARAEESAALWTGGPRSAAVAEARGELLRAEGRGEEAEVAFRRAVEGYAVVGHRLHEDRVRDLLAVPA
jgi:DNA-binding SARP family transcriptional activator/tetratricopeptide (TPR) repeat protein